MIGEEWLVDEQIQIAVLLTLVAVYCVRHFIREVVRYIERLLQENRERLATELREHFAAELRAQVDRLVPELKAALVAASESTKAELGKIRDTMDHVRNELLLAIRKVEAGVELFDRKYGASHLEHQTSMETGLQNVDHSVKRGGRSGVWWGIAFLLAGLILEQIFGKP